MVDGLAIKVRALSAKCQDHDTCAHEQHRPEEDSHSIVAPSAALLSARTTARSPHAFGNRHGHDGCSIAQLPAGMTGTNAIAG